jgi:hypothetical protein
MDGWWTKAARESALLMSGNDDSGSNDKSMNEDESPRQLVAEALVSWDR